MGGVLKTCPGWDIVNSKGDRVVTRNPARAEVGEHETGIFTGGMYRHPFRRRHSTRRRSARDSRRWRRNLSLAIRVRGFWPPGFLSNATTAHHALDLSLAIQSKAAAERIAGGKRAFG